MISPEILITTVVIAIVQLVNYVRSKEWSSVVTIIAAGIVGAGVGFFHFMGIDVATGILLGLGAVGIHTLASAIKSN